MNDGSGKAINKLRVRLYYYTSMATVAPDLLETLRDREELGVFLRNNVSPANAGNGTSARTLREAKPRPPCVIIVGQ